MEGGPPDFRADSSCPYVLRILSLSSSFRLRDSHLLRLTFPSHSAMTIVALSVHYPGCISTPGLASFAFARRYSRNLVCSLFLCLLRCFSSAGSLYIPMDSVCTSRGCSREGCPIRISADLGLFAAPRSFSQLVTSFFGSQCLGILHMLFFA